MRVCLSVVVALVLLLLVGGCRRNTPGPGGVSGFTAEEKLVAEAIQKEYPGATFVRWGPHHRWTEEMILARGAPAKAGDVIIRVAFRSRGPDGADVLSDALVFIRDGMLPVADSEHRGRYTPMTPNFGGDDWQRMLDGE